MPEEAADTPTGKSLQAMTGAIGDIIRIAGENPDAKKAGAELGKTALTITKAINNALMPLAAINFGFEKAKRYFEEKFEADMEASVQSIPKESVVEPKASIAGPALQGLAFSHEEPALKELYLKLLASAMDSRTATAAHPAFVEIIRQLDAEEAQLIGGALRSAAGIPIVEVRLQKIGSTGWNVLHRHLLNLQNSSSKMLVENSRIEAVVDNWIRLGLVTVRYDAHLVGESLYDWIDNRPEVKRLKELHESETGKISFANGYMQRTSFGIQFAQVVGISEQPKNQSSTTDT